MYKTLLATLTATALSTVAVAAAPAVSAEPLDAATLNTIKSQFGRLMELANNHDFKALHGMFWQSPSTLLVAKSAIPSEGNWAGFWGNEAIDQKLHDIGSSGPVVLEPDYSKLKVVGLTRDVAESYVPMNITVSYAGTGWNSQAVSDDHQLASRREGLEGRFRNHSAGAAGTRREGLRRARSQFLYCTEGFTFLRTERNAPGRHAAD